MLAKRRPFLTSPVLFHENKNGNIISILLYQVEVGVQYAKVRNGEFIINTVFDIRM